jgi:hypothetical protein
MLQIIEDIRIIYLKSYKIITGHRKNYKSYKIMEIKDEKA